MTGGAPVAPTELAPGEDPALRFLSEVAAVEGTTATCARDGVAAAVAEAVTACGATRVALAADLGAARDEIHAALAAAGVDACRYEDVAGDRTVVRNLEATVTGCLAAVAATGSVLVGGPAGRAGALAAATHVCVVERDRLVPGLAELMRRVPSLPWSSVSLQSGPSRTADIEKTLVLGMHGPKAVHVVLVDGHLGGAAEYRQPY